MTNPTAVKHCESMKKRRQVAWHDMQFNLYFRRIFLVSLRCFMSFFLLHLVFTYKVLTGLLKIADYSVSPTSFEVSVFLSFHLYLSLCCLSTFSRKRCNLENFFCKWFFSSHFKYPQCHELKWGATITGRFKLWKMRNASPLEVLLALHCAQMTWHGFKERLS